MKAVGRLTKEELLDLAVAAVQKQYPTLEVGNGRWVEEGKWEDQQIVGLEFELTERLRTR